MLTLKELHDIIAEMRIDKVVTTPMNEQERLKDAVIKEQKDDDSVLQHKSDSTLRKDGKDQQKK